MKEKDVVDAIDFEVSIILETEKDLPNLSMNGFIGLMHLRSVARQLKLSEVVKTITALTDADLGINRSENT